MTTNTTEVTMNSLVQERKDLFALAAWIQTFPECKSSLTTGDADDNFERLLTSLNSPEVASYVTPRHPSILFENST